MASGRLRRLWLLFAVPPRLSGRARLQPSPVLCHRFPGADAARLHRRVAARRVSVGATAVVTASFCAEAFARAPCTTRSRLRRNSASRPHLGRSSSGARPMQCPQCHAENPERARFCEDCGVRLEFKCPHCSESATPGKKFCASCGGSLDTAPTTSRTSPQDYTPRHLAERIISSRSVLEGEGIPAKRLDLFYAPREFALG